METVLFISNLSKRYGHIHAVKELSLTVEKGSVFGVLGPNGSGKTTTLGIILGAIHLDGGSYSWFGESSAKDHMKRIGAILEYPNFYPYLSAMNNLKIVADIKVVPYYKIDDVLKLVNLFSRKDDLYKTYSLGMKQRLAIASALLSDPEVLVLDEPTNGMDPQGIVEIRELILKFASKGITIIIASHMLDEIEKICTHIAVLKSGKSLFIGKVEAILSENTLVELAASDIQQLQKILSESDGIKSIIEEDNKLLVSYANKIDPAELNNYLFTKGIVLTHLVVKKKSLEKQFMEVIASGK